MPVTVALWISPFANRTLAVSLASAPSVRDMRTAPLNSQRLSSKLSPLACAFAAVIFVGPWTMVTSLNTSTLFFVSKSEDRASTVIGRTVAVLRDGGARRDADQHGRDQGPRD